MTLSDDIAATRAELLDRLAAMADADDIAEAVTTALLEAGGAMDVPQIACGVVEMQLHGIVAHGRDLNAACLAWVEAARRARDADPA